MPREILNLADLHQFDNLELLARQVVEGFIIGLHKSPFHGFSVEFAEHRLYNPGESVKNVDWKVYARTDRMYVKKYEEETNLRAQIVIDGSSSMFFPEGSDQEGRPQANKINFSVLSAAALMYLLKMQRDAFGLSIFSEEVETHTGVRSTSMHYRLLINHLQELLQRKGRNIRTDASNSLHLIAERIHKRSLVMIFSDMFENALDENRSQDELFAALQHLKYNKHEVILFHTVDRQRELEFQYDNRPYLFVDLETGEKVRLRGHAVKEHYIAQVRKFEKNLRLRCAQYKIDFVEADINKDFKQVLQPYLMKRGRLY